MKRINRDVTIMVEYGTRRYTRVVRRSSVPSLVRGLLVDINICAQELRADIVS